jgi:hypothetical protein
MSFLPDKEIRIVHEAACIRGGNLHRLKEGMRPS